MPPAQDPLSLITTHTLLFLLLQQPSLSFFFFFNDTATTEIYTLSLHDALPISPSALASHRSARARTRRVPVLVSPRSEEHTSELQSPCNLVCRLLLEKKKNRDILCRRSLVEAYTSR